MFRPLGVERIEIFIDPDTLEYNIEMNACNIGHIYAVLKNLCERIENGDLGEEVEITEEDSGRKLSRDEYRAIIGARKDSISDGEDS